MRVSLIVSGMLLFFSATLSAFNTRNLIDYSESGECMFFSVNAHNEIVVDFAAPGCGSKFDIFVSRFANSHPIRFIISNPPFAVAPAQSSDGANWQDVSMTRTGTDFIITLQFTHESGWLRLKPQPMAKSQATTALSYYNYARLTQYVDSVKNHQYIDHEVLGQSVQGRDIDLFTVTNPQASDAGKKIMWQQFRVHGNEMQQSYIMEGLIDWLLTDTSDLAGEIRDRMLWKIIPAINPDGIVANTRQSSEGLDLNRQYDSTTQYREPDEIKAIHTAMDELILTNNLTVSFAIDHHTWPSSNGDGGYRTRASVAGHPYVDDQVTFLSHLIRFDTWQRWSKWTFSDGRAGMGRLALRKQHGLNIITSESTGNKRITGAATTEADLYAQGQAFAKSIYRYLFHIYLTDENGNNALQFVPSDEVYIKLDDSDANTSGSLVEDYAVTLTSSTTGDSEQVLLEEVDADDSLFTSTGIALEEAAANPNDGMLQIGTVDRIVVYYADADFENDQCWDDAVIDVASGNASLRFAAGRSALNVTRRNKLLTVTGLTHNSKLSITDLNGRLIAVRKAGNASTARFETGRLTNGIYCLRVNSGSIVNRKLFTVSD
ncbi:MAG: hypothetical protein GF398_00065 [Chitinivibrionales bacterium]|nr:hypothetical protein [Chitinivibrionales bacterium]